MKQEISFKDYFTQKALKKVLTDYFEKKYKVTSYRKIFAEKLDFLQTNQNKIFKKVIADILSQGYFPEPVIPRKIVTAGKARTIYYYHPVDDFLCFVMKEIFDDVAAKIYHEKVYSYQKYVSKLKPIKSFGKFVKQYVQHIQDPKNRGLFVLRRDIKSYGENISLKQNSFLWKKIDRVFDNNFAKDEFFEPVKKLFKNLCQPEIYSKQGNHINIIGIADGNSLSCVLLNFYLEPIDELLSGVSDGFYARYGDDIIFAHADYKAIKKCSENIDRVVADLGLGFSKNKCSDYYFNAAARVYENDISFQPVQAINYLGLSVNFKGEIEIRSDKLREFYLEMRQRVINTSVALNPSKDKKLDVISLIMEEAFNLSNPMISVRIEDLMIINSRSQIKDIDYKLRLMIIKEVTKKNSVKALREISFRELIEKNEIHSFKHYINKQI